jgi:hypothetical protein
VCPPETSPRVEATEYRVATPGKVERSVPLPPKRSSAGFNWRSRCGHALIVTPAAASRLAVKKVLTFPIYSGTVSGRCCYVVEGGSCMALGAKRQLIDTGFSGGPGLFVSFFHSASRDRSAHMRRHA